MDKIFSRKKPIIWIKKITAKQNIGIKKALLILNGSN
jgi:hypothetical protein